MSKRRRRTYAKEQPTTLLQPDVKVNVEIDYDKLAQAIVKAEQITKEQNDKEIKSVLWLQRKGSAILFRMLAVVGIFFAAAIMMGLVFSFEQMQWGSYSYVVANILTILIVVLSFVVVLIISTMLWGSSQEIGTVKDKHLLIALSSGLTSFIALAVAVIAIFVK